MTSDDNLTMFVDPKIPARLGAPLLGFNPTTTSQQSSATNTGVNISSQMNGVVSPPTFPVIVFSHGMGSSFFPYSSICCDLASHGFVVAALEHRDGSSCCFLHRVAENGVKEGDYDNYKTYWIPYFLAPKDNYPLRHKQVIKALKKWNDNFSYNNFLCTHSFLAISLVFTTF